MRRRLVVTLLAVPAVVGACASHPSDPAPPQGALVVGVQAEDLGPFVGPVHIVVKLDGAVASDQTVTIGPNAPPGGLPKEVPLTGAPGAKVDVEVTGFAPGTTTGTPAVSRLAGAHLFAVAPAAPKKLLRVVLQERCTTTPTTRGGTSGPLPTISCTAPLTCISARCASGEVPDAQLEDYDPQWASAPPDICRPSQHGPPEVVVGTGQTDYGPLADGATVQMELGPQGGHHIWIATRMKNLRQSGSTTTITANVLDATAAIPPAAYVFTYDQDEGSYCKLYGLRFQLDSGASDLANAYKAFLGKTIDVTVTVTDTTKATASGTKKIVLGTTLICPDGTQSCNL